MLLVASDSFSSSFPRLHSSSPGEVCQRTLMRSRWLHGFCFCWFSIVGFLQVCLVLNKISCDFLEILPVLSRADYHSRHVVDPKSTCVRIGPAPILYRKPSLSIHTPGPPVSSIRTGPPCLMIAQPHAPFACFYSSGYSSIHRAMTVDPHWNIRGSFCVEYVCMCNVPMCPITICKFLLTGNHDVASHSCPYVPSDKLVFPFVFCVLTFGSSNFELLMTLVTKLLIRIIF